MRDLRETGAGVRREGKHADGSTDRTRGAREAGVPLRSGAKGKRGAVETPTHMFGKRDVWESDRPTVCGREETSYRPAFRSSIPRVVRQRSEPSLSRPPPCHSYDSTQPRRIFSLTFAFSA